MNKTGESNAIPEQELVVRIGAHFIEPLDAAGDAISMHVRQFGKERTDTIDWTTMLDQLITKPGAWKNSVMREQVSYDLLQYSHNNTLSRKQYALYPYFSRRNPNFVCATNR